MVEYDKLNLIINVLITQTNNPQNPVIRPDKSSVDCSDIGGRFFINGIPEIRVKAELLTQIKSKHALNNLVHLAVFLLLKKVCIS